MILAGGDGDRFTLTITGYQFDWTCGDPFDDNWLEVHATLSIPGFTGASAQGPILLTSEIAELSDLLSGAPGMEIGAVTRSEFLEPDLEIALTRLSEAEFVVDVTLITRTGTVSASLTTDLTGLELAVGELAADAVAFPSRA